MFPLLDIADNEERFCSVLGACKGASETEEVLSAFQHHCFEESERKIVFADFQGMPSCDDMLSSLTLLQGITMPN